MQGILRKTLIIRFSSVGDIVLSTPLIRALRRRFPKSQIDFLVKSEYAELLRGNPNLSTVIEFPVEGTMDDLHRLRREVLDSGYDLIIDIHGSLRSRILCRGKENVVRVRKRVFPRFLLVQLKRDLYRYFGGSPGVADRYFEIVHPWNVADDGEGPEVFPPASAHARVGQLLGSLNRPEAPLIGICPTARHFTKIWPAERFAEAGATLARKHRAALLIFGSPDESERCREIARQILSLEPAVQLVDLSGKVSLIETAAALDLCKVVLTNDSGLMHVAAARKRKIVALFGSTVRQFGFFPPAGQSLVLEQHELSCRPCTHIGRARCPRGHFRCMLDIPPSRVIDAVGAFMQS